MSQVAINAATSLAAVFVMNQNRKWTSGELIPDWILAVTRIGYKENNTPAEKMVNPYIAAISDVCFLFLAIIPMNKS